MRLVLKTGATMMNTIKEENFDEIEKIITPRNFQRCSSSSLRVAMEVGIKIKILYVLSRFWSNLVQLIFICSTLKYCIKKMKSSCLFSCLCPLFYVFLPKCREKRMKWAVQNLAVWLEKEKVVVRSRKVHCNQAPNIVDKI